MGGKVYGRKDVRKLETSTDDRAEVAVKHEKWRHTFVMLSHAKPQQEGGIQHLRCIEASRFALDSKVDLVWSGAASIGGREKWLSSRLMSELEAGESRLDGKRKKR